MIDVRQAGPDDADELMVLRGVMTSALWGRGDAQPGEWMATGARLLRQRLGAELAAFVVDRDDAPGLAACAVGQIDQRLPGPGDPTGRRGYVYNVATRPGHRRRGYSRACMRALLTWFEEAGVTTVDLRASEQGEPLYRDLGFEPTSHPSLRRVSQR
ncbi:GNAT family N-acetyltransferase [Actinoplanes sp. NPDC051470]|uniref:GNAT family N-acetyltransferase n=1 Tax=Actinoplanes sp. NPDC051470 TaxID=3157224 RepID=UPI00342347E8